MLPRRSIPVLLALALAAATAAAYAGLAKADFVSYDDPPYVTGNLAVRQGLTAEGLSYAFTTFEMGNWHPLTWLSHMAVVDLAGLDPRAHHLVDLGLHVLCVLLLFGVLRAATGRTGPSATAAGLFALHPLHVESVAWIAERKDVLSTVFWLAAMGFHVAWARRRRPWAYAGVVLSLALGLMAKPMLVTLPFALLLLDVWPLRRPAPREAGGGGERWSRLALEKLPLLAIAAASSVVTVIAQRSAGAVVTGEASPPGVRLANALLAVGIYLRKTVWPTDLAVIYPFTTDLDPLEVGASALVVAALTAGAWWCRRRRPAVLVGWLWFLGTLVPVIGLVQVGSQAYADRYTYVPHVGLFVALVFGVSGWLRLEQRRLVGPALAAAALVPCFLLTRAQVRVWRDDLALYGHAVEVTEANHVATELLASALFRAGRHDEALAAWEESLRIAPDHAAAHVNLGKALYDLQRLDEAEAHLRRAVELAPDSADAHGNLGVTLCVEGRFDEGVAQIEEALRLDPGNASAHNNLATWHLREGRLQLALEHYQAALRLDPDHVQAAVGIARIRSTSSDPALRDPEEAVALAERAEAATHGNDPKAIHVLAIAYAAAGRFEDAAAAARRAIERSTAIGQPAFADLVRRSLAGIEARRRPWE